MRKAEEMSSAERTALYRTLAHPLRGQILAYLGKHGEANSAALAGVLHESTGTTSYHLRKLAELGLIEEIAEKSAGRERWWKSVPFQHVTPDPAAMAPEELAAAEHLARLRASRDTDLYHRAVREWTGPDGWAQLWRAGSYLTKDQVAAFAAEFQELLRRYQVMRADAPDDARQMNIRLFAVPDEQA
ncbi:helix-turn-helix domain-containing protein [Nocardia sp. NPDC052566]|uniref:helix-turn-helix domain-containing protein n=1 Tax=Nocardia sp. NPDC052566 TaxID=3364330 RepID=UPI0037C5E19A